MRRQVARWIGRAAAAVALVLLGYVAAGLVGGAIPRNPRWRPPSSGVTVWVESNGIHTGLVLPKVAAGPGWRVDWRDLARPGDLADPRYARLDHLAVGWGEEAFYLGTSEWKDVRPGPLLRAAAGSDRTLLHVEHVAAPARPASDQRRLVLRPDEYRRLAAFVRASLRPAGARHRGYGPGDAFYEGRGRYSAARTCNVWTGDALAAAGVRVGWWTPFPVTVLGWF